MRNLKISLFLFLAVGLFPACENDSEKEPIDTEPIVFTKEGELEIFTPTGGLVQKLNIEIADNDFERETGLMYRESMENDQAMLFIFDNAAPRFFYMKNTLIPLDIIYFGSDSTAVSIQKNARPRDLTPLPSEEPAQFVLEINAGLVDDWGIEPGYKIDFEPLSGE